MRGEFSYRHVGLEFREKISGLERAVENHQHKNIIERHVTITGKFIIDSSDLKFVHDNCKDI